MMIKTIIIFLAGVLFWSYGAFAQAARAVDPFDSLLPEKEGQTSTGEPAKPAMPPPVTVQGAIWDTDTPQVIIDDEVYKVGDTLKGMDAKVYKIEKNTVFIFYEGRLYEMKVAGKKEAAQ
ncbi:MAG: hypothetical protein PHP17_06050 [Candidatus Omnitrophica bacterium]|nr:hypothetical protein [Candidatus Omnitrophota bacterium]